MKLSAQLNRSSYRAYRHLNESRFHFEDLHSRCLVAGVVIRRLQAAQNAAARLITGMRRNQHITPTLQDVYHIGYQCRSA